MSETWLLAAEGLVLVLLFLFVWVVARSAARGLGELDMLASNVAVAEPAPRVVPLPPPSAQAPPRAEAPMPAPTPPVAPPPPPPPVSTDTRPQPILNVGEPLPPAPAEDAPHPGDTGLFGLSENIRPRLIVDSSPSLNPGLEVELEGGVTIGRSSSSQLAIDDSFVSHMHARIFRRGPFYFIEDLGSTNGTYINGRRVDGQGQLKVHDELRMGETVLRYEE